MFKIILLSKLLGDYNLDSMRINFQKNYTTIEIVRGL